VVLGRLLAPSLLVAGLVGSPFLPTRGAAAALDRPRFASVAEAPEREALFERLGVPPWHAAGLRGRGVKVAVLDSGFCGYRAFLGRALPARVQARSFRADGNLEAPESQHGILCAEVIHALAPDAELLLANWEPGRPEQFLQAVRWARAQGARILSCSVIMPSWSDCEGHGPVHQALGTLLGAGDQPGDLLCVASAGNTALRHWGGPFRDRGDGWHLWAPGQAGNGIHPWGDERVSVELCGQPGVTYELVVYDRTAGRETGRARTGRKSWVTSWAPPSFRCAVVPFAPEPGHLYALGVRRVAGTPGPFHVVVLGGSLTYATRRGSIPFPGDGPEVVAVGAVDWRGTRLPYSSCGPDTRQPKPDFVAPVPFPSRWRDRPFAGTSAAAPQAAALAALVWSCHPDWTALQVRQALRLAARHPGAVLPAGDTGYGEVHLPGGLPAPSQDAQPLPPRSPARR
jgi:hypothetical protein